MVSRRFLFILVVLSFCFTAAGFATPVLARSSVASPLAAPAAFGKITPENNDTIVTSRLTFQWEASTPGVIYEYCLFTKNTCPPGHYKPVGNSTSITVTLKPSTTYYWQVRAHAADGSITYADGGARWRFTTGSASPTGFTKSGPSIGAGDQSINPTLTWSPSNGLNVNYQVCYDTTGNNTCDSGVWLLVGPGTSYTLHGLDYNTPYYWQVRAVNSRGTVYADGSAAAFWSFTTRNAPPSPFVKLVPVDESAGSPLNVNLIWSPSVGTNLTYQYCLVTDLANNPCETSGSGWVTTGTNTSAAPDGLVYNETYYWQVRALNNGNANDTVEANDGAWWSFNTLIDQPTSFSKILPLHGATDVSLTPYLYWYTSSGVGITYEYCVIPAASLTCDKRDWVNVDTDTSVRLNTPLQNSTSYLWQVRARDAVNALVYPDGGAMWRFTTLPEAPEWIPPAQGLSTPEDPAAPYTGHLEATNPDNKTLVYTLFGRPPAGSFLLSSGGDFAFTPEQNFNGSVTFRFTIWDGVNEPSGPFTAVIGVTPVNDKPTIGPIADVTSFSGMDIYFTIETSDADLPYSTPQVETLTITLSGALPAGAVFTTLTDAVTHVTSADFDWPGASWLPSQPYTFTARVTDSQGAYAEDTFTVTLIPEAVYLPFVGK